MEMETMGKQVSMATRNLETSNSKAGITKNIITEQEGMVTVLFDILTNNI